MLLMLCIASSNSSLAQSGDARILAARDALRSGDRVTLERLASQSDPHPLDPYVRYWLLFNKLARPDP
ncbi:transglycosylase, partial [Azoarcus communis SWub3 = DSM 12120]|nr:transglycosylase [Parazoarcus communis SWub3 = DSM 12120]